MTVAEKTPDLSASGTELKTRAELEGVAPSAIAPHMFDGYVFGHEPNLASYTPDPLYSFNRTGGAITITKPAGTTGSYTVRFQGLSALLGSTSTVKVTGMDGDASYCKPTINKVINDIVYIRCLNGRTGAPVNAYYTVVVTRNYVELAFAHAHLKSSTDYPPLGNSSWNPAGTMRVFRYSTGEYQVQFNGLGSRLSSTNRGHPQVVAISSDAAHCKVRTWGVFNNPNLDIYVGCMSRTGVPKDLKFNVLFLMPANRLGYAWANLWFTPSYEPNTSYSYNSSGGAIGIIRSGTGRYTITFSGLGAELLGAGNVQVTASGDDNARCKVETWDYANGIVYVRCFAPGGALVDAQYNVFLGS
jgi:hypothetical protein